MKYPFNNFYDRASSTEDFHKKGYKYTPYNKGGTARKWFGNLEYVLKYDRTHYEILLNQGNHLPSRQYYFKPAITWSDVTSSSLGATFRYEPLGTVFDGSAAVAFVNEANRDYLLGLLNTKYVKMLAKVFNPTLILN